VYLDASYIIEDYRNGAEYKALGTTKGTYPTGKSLVMI